MIRGLTRRSGALQNPFIERNQVAKTKAQAEKQKRATEKRKKTEKAILKMAAEMPDDDPGQASTAPITGAKAIQDKP